MPTTDLCDIAVEPLSVAATLADDLTPPFVAPFDVVSYGGRIFLAFKQPGENRITFHEFLPATIKLREMGEQEGMYYKDGAGGIGFDTTGKAWYFTTSSPDPSTGSAARLVVSDEVEPLRIPPITLQATYIQNLALTIVNERLRLPGTIIGEAVRLLVQAELEKRGL